MSVLLKVWFNAMVYCNLIIFCICYHISFLVYSVNSTDISDIVKVISANECTLKVELNA